MRHHLHRVVEGVRELILAPSGLSPPHSVPGIRGHHLHWVVFCSGGVRELILTPGGLGQLIASLASPSQGVLLYEVVREIILTPGWWSWPA
jgi:hypothetical protein